MSAYLVKCWLEKAAAAVVKHAHRHHRKHRIGRHFHRAAGVVASKPAALVWVCVVTGGAWWGAGIPGWQSPAQVAQQPTAPLTGGSAGQMPGAQPLSAERTSPVSFSGTGPLAYLPPEAIANLPPGPLAFAPIPDFSVVPPIPETPTVPPPETITPAPPQPPQSVPEPSSLLALATALGAAVAWGRLS